MALFPAYSLGDTNNTEREDKELPNSIESGKNNAGSQESWLQNASFDVGVSQIPLPPTTTAPAQEAQAVPADVQHSSKPKKKYKDKGKSKRKSEETFASGSNTQAFWEDHKREKANLSVPMLYRPAVPLFQCKIRRILGLDRRKHVFGKVRKKDRYHVRMQRLNKTSSQSQEDAEFTSKTAEYNKAVADDPQDVSAWLAYVRFQDVENSVRCMVQEAACRGGTRVTAERQLAILDRALTLNPDNGALLRERVLVADQVLPAESLQEQLAALLDKQVTNLEAWQAYVECSQCSLATCSASRVLSLYNEALEKLHQSRRGVPMAQARVTQDKLVDLLLRCCMFLRQSGLQEQLWALLNMCLELNLSSCSLPHPEPLEQQLGNLAIFQVHPKSHVGNSIKKMLSILLSDKYSSTIQTTKYN